LHERAGSSKEVHKRSTQFQNSAAKNKWLARMRINGSLGMKSFRFKFKPEFWSRNHECV